MLELNNYSSPSIPARLNVQFILLLLTLGVPLNVFQRLIQDQLDLIGRILTDRNTAFMYIKGELDASAEDNYSQGCESDETSEILYVLTALIIAVYEMLLACHDMSEPAVQQRLLKFQETQYNSLRKKMNLRVQESCYLFGVVDEDGILGENEVYINLPDRTGVLVRDVIVGR